MITSDHGEEFLDHGFVSHHFRSAMAEELIRVPLLVKPSQNETFEPGQRVESVVRMVDFAPTLLDYAGIEKDSYTGAHMDGTSLRTLVEGQHGQDRTAFISTIEWGIVRNGKWKYRLEKPRDPTHESSERLFAIRDDPMEKSDVSSEYPNELAKMRGQFERFSTALKNRQGSGSFEVERPESILSEEDKERLEALGYFHDGG
jgi:arylsulfatase A-like enzyme